MGSCKVGRGSRSEMTPMDTMSKFRRSRLMGRIRTFGTVPELAVRSGLHRAGLRFTLRRSDLPGRPDVVLPARSSVVFVHGCFWHGHRGCRRAVTPKTNTRFWIDKISTNRSRDRRVATRLRGLGWRVFVVWECRISAASMASLVRSLKSISRTRHRASNGRHG